MRPRILIFEDNEFISFILKDILDDLGYEVHTYSNPGLCPLYLNYNCQSDYSCSDIIISDLNMPVENGLDFIKDLLNRGCKVKSRALMSADWTDGDIQYAEELGCKIFSKPFDMKELLDWLEHCRKKIDPKRVLSDW